MKCPTCWRKMQGYYARRFECANIVWRVKKKMKKKAITVTLPATQIANQVSYL